MNYSANFRAVVVDNADPKGLSRVRLRIPQILGDGPTGWAYPIGNGSVPAVNAAVWATFEGGDISFPVYLPSLAGSSHTHPESDVASLVSDIANLSTTKANLSGAAFTGNVSTTGTLTATSTISASGLAGSLLSSVTPLVNGVVAAVGTSATPSREDHVHPSDYKLAPLSGAAFSGSVSTTGTLSASSTVSASGLAGSLLSSATPLINGTATQGVSTIPSRQDHVHPTDTTRAASAHSHAESDVTNLVTDLSNRAPSASPTFTGTVSLPSTTNYNGLQMKRVYSGSVSVSFTSGTGTLSFPSTLPFTPSSVIVGQGALTGTDLFVVTLSGAATSSSVGLKIWKITLAAPPVISQPTTGITVYWVAFE